MDGIDTSNIKQFDVELQGSTKYISAAVSDNTRAAYQGDVAHFLERDIRYQLSLIRLLVI